MTVLANRREGAHDAVERDLVFAYALLLCRLDREVVERHDSDQLAGTVEHGRRPRTRISCGSLDVLFALSPTAPAVPR